MNDGCWLLAIQTIYFLVFSYIFLQGKVHFSYLHCISPDNHLQKCHIHWQKVKGVFYMTHRQKNHRESQNNVVLLSEATLYVKELHKKRRNTCQNSPFFSRLCWTSLHHTAAAAICAPLLLPPAAAPHLFNVLFPAILPLLFSLLSPDCSVQHLGLMYFDLSRTCSSTMLHLVLWWQHASATGVHFTEGHTSIYQVFYL